jgi:hypothetical protein
MDEVETVLEIPLLTHVTACAVDPIDLNVGHIDFIYRWCILKFHPLLELYELDYYRAPKVQATPF